MVSADDASGHRPNRSRQRPDPGAIEWFYRQEGTTYGPVSSLDLRAAARLGFLGPDDHVLRYGQDTWVPARSVRWLFKPRSRPT